MSSFHSYPSIFGLGHKAIQFLLSTDVQVEEKIDGSQFSFGLFDELVAVPITECLPYLLDAVPTRELKVRSKGAVMHPDAPEKMFTAAVESVKARLHLLHVGWTYRAEYLCKAHHNALAYDRIPNGHLIIFDINSGEEEYLDYEAKKAEAERIGLEVVPRLYSGRLDSIEQFRQFLCTTSILGGQAIEGVVVKPVGYDLFGKDKKCLFGKFVSEAYKETHSKSWSENNPTGKDIIGLIGGALNSQARWQKALQHMKEAGKIEDSVRDIGLLMREIPEDVKKECEEEIKEQLFKWAWPHLRRAVTRGVPEFYKEHLLKLQFERAIDTYTDLAQLSGIPAEVRLSSERQSEVVDVNNSTTSSDSVVDNARSDG